MPYRLNSSGSTARLAGNISHSPSTELHDASRCKTDAMNLMVGWILVIPSTNPRMTRVTFGSLKRATEAA